MPSKKPPYRGRFQAQGKDIPDGYSYSWARDAPVTDKDGLEFINNVKKQCNQAQLRERKSSFEKAENFVKTKSKEGGIDTIEKPVPISYSWYGRGRTKNARVDLEIVCGKTFIPSDD